MNKDDRISATIGGASWLPVQAVPGWVDRTHKDSTTDDQIHTKHPPSCISSNSLTFLAIHILTLWHQRASPLPPPGPAKSMRARLLPPRAS